MPAYIVSMDETGIRNMAVKAIREELAAYRSGATRILLFGSRARGQGTAESDWDFMAVTQRALTREEKTRVKLAVRRRMAEQLVPVDLIIKDEATFKRQVDNVGLITYYASRDGIAV